VVTLPIEIWAQHICSFLHPHDVTTLACVNSTARLWVADHDMVWKTLWMRDYGRALLQWPVGRHVLERSLDKRLDEETNNNASKVVAAAGLQKQQQQTLEQRLSDFLDRLGRNHHNKQTAFSNSTFSIHATRTSCCTATLKEFYFSFGEVYVNYLIAGYNTTDQNSHGNGSPGCYVGIHSHIFDFGAFSEYHPGLVEPILLQCGKDATAYFEDIPHSRVARDLARRLCVIANVSCLQDNPNRRGHPYGLVYHGPSSSSSDQDQPSETFLQQQQEILQQSNTRPPPPPRNQPPDYLIPNKTKRIHHTKSSQLHLHRRPPTLARVRQEWQVALEMEQRRIDKKQQQEQRNPWTMMMIWPSMGGPTSSSQPAIWRIYYDPLVGRWETWNAAPSY
jgi:cytochrome b involved in lipid metabolism